MKKISLIIALVVFTGFFQKEPAPVDMHWDTDLEAFDYTKQALKEESVGGFSKLEINLKVTEKLESLAPLNIDMAFFKEKLKQISGVLPVTINGEKVFIKERSGKDLRRITRQFLKSEYEKLGYKVEILKYSSGANIAAYNPNSDASKTIILSSHIDSVGNAGANDNGTGTIGVLAAAKALKNQQIEGRIIFLGFDQEEIGLVGSKQYVAKLSSEEKSNIAAVINFEMMGTNSRKDGGFHIIDCGRADSVGITKTFENILSQKNISLKKVSGCTSRSDHSSFWKKGIPAVVISENFFGGDSDRCYHSRCDIVDDRLDYTYMENIIKAATYTALTL